MVISQHIKEKEVWSKLLMVFLLDFPLFFASAEPANNAFWALRIKHTPTFVETIEDSDGILLLNEKTREEGLDHKNLRVTTIKYLSNHRKHRYALIDEPTEFLKAKN